MLIFAGLLVSTEIILENIEAESRTIIYSIHF